MPEVRHFSADCLRGAVTGVERIGELAELESLSIGMWELKDFDFLNSVPSTLRKLQIGATKSKRPTLSPLVRFQELETLYLEGQQKDVEVLHRLSGLRDVTLRSISTAGLDYLKPLRELRSLDLKLGGIRDLSAIAGMDGINYLEVWQARGLSDLGVVAELPGLQYLFLQSPGQRAFATLAALTAEAASRRADEHDGAARLRTPRVRTALGRVRASRSLRQPAARARTGPAESRTSESPGRLWQCQEEPYLRPDV